MDHDAASYENFAETIIDRLFAMVGAGKLPAEAWTIDGPHMPQIHVDGVATTYTTVVGESEVILRHSEIMAGRSNHDWNYTISVSRNDLVIAHEVTDDDNSMLGRLICEVADLCEPTVAAAQVSALGDFDLS